MADDPQCPALAPEHAQRHAVAVLPHLRIVADVIGVQDMNDVVIGLPGGRLLNANQMVRVGGACQDGQ